jgi:SAM-dependent methyltransferase
MSLLRRIRARVYDTAIVPMTALWYAAVLERLPPRCRLLDVGIGTGAALLENASVLEAKDIRVCGVDIDAAYIDRCREAVAARGLVHRIEARLESIDEHAGGPYDAAYFSGSFMLLPDPVAALRHVTTLLEADAAIYFTQTFEHERSRVVEILKPALRFLTTIDFGEVTYEHEFDRALSSAGVAIEHRAVLHAGRTRSSVLVISRPSSVALVQQSTDDACEPAIRADRFDHAGHDVDPVTDFDPGEPVVVPIEDSIDLHPFQPRDIPVAVEAYLEAAVEKGFREVRLIHGRGTGFQRDRVRGILSQHPDVESFDDAPPQRGGWGATVVVLKRKGGGAR